MFQLILLTLSLQSPTANARLDEGRSAAEQNVADSRLAKRFQNHFRGLGSFQPTGIQSRPSHASAGCPSRNRAGVIAPSGTDGRRNAVSAK